MAIIRWNPGSFGSQRPTTELERLRNQIDGLFENLAGPAGRLGRGGAGVFPLINLGEDEENLYLTAELAGVSASDLELSVHGDNLILRGERKISQTDQKVNYHRREREAGIFRRVISLPVKIDGDGVKAVTQNGVLKVTLPKAKEAKPRQITVNVA